MHKGRLEAFSDGVFAIIVTIMVLEMRPPAGSTLMALRPVLPVFLSYVLSYVFLGIYWNNHHHLLQAIRRVNGRILWANLLVLFWLSLIPFVTHWLGENWTSPWPVALYGIVMLGAGAGYFALTRALIAHHGCDSVLASAIGADAKGRVSLALYAAAIPLAFRLPAASCALFIAVAIMWLIPDRRIERLLEERG